MQEGAACTRDDPEHDIGANGLFKPLYLGDGADEERTTNVEVELLVCQDISTTTMLWLSPLPIMQSVKAETEGRQAPSWV